MRAVLDAAARCDRDGQDPRYTLWAAWQRSGLQRRWLAASERGGPGGAQATRDLDAVTALFDVTDQYVSRTPGASLRGLVEHIAALRLPGVTAEPADGTQQVRVLSAHAALGHEWDLVVIAGLQDGLWPNTIPRGGVLGTQRLLDALDGVTEDASVRAPLLAEERRLLVAAMGRARRRLLVTAVDSDTGGAGEEAALPSPFFFELAAWDTDAGDPEPLAPISAPRVLSAAALVGRLRGVVCAPDGAVGDAARGCAATQLARLAHAGVPGADPAGWHGLTPVSTDDSLCGAADVVTLTPSTLQALTDCPLRWLAERHGGTNARDLRSTIGSVLHALIAQPGKTESQLLAELERAWEHLPFDAQWHSDNELARYRAMIEAFVEWRTQSRRELTEVGVEVDVDGVLGVRREDGGEVRLRGRVDRLERDAAGRLVIVDVKTGKTPVSKDDAQQHAQLAMYQLAVAEGLLPAGPAGAEPGGARLVYPARTGASGVVEREQDPLTPTARDEWRQPHPTGRRRHRRAAVHRPTQRRVRALPGPAVVSGARQESARGDPLRPAPPPRDYSPTELACALGLFPPTEEQAAVIAAPPGPLVVIAGAGAGKTETMAARVVWLVANGYAEPGQVLGLTFTRKAAGQLLRRVRSRLARLAGIGLGATSPAGRHSVEARTPRWSAPTTRFAGSLLRDYGLLLPVEPDARLLSETELWQLAFDVVNGYGGELDTGKTPAAVTSMVLRLSGQLAEHLVDTDQLRDTHVELERLIHHLPAGPYQRDRGPSQWLLRLLATQTERAELVPLLDALAERMRAAKVMDFGTQMASAARLAATFPQVGHELRGRYRVVLLDEYQDTGHAQRIALSALFGGGRDDGWR